MLTLRPYQQEAVTAVYAHLRQRDDNPCVVIPTGGGKTPVMATICRDAVVTWSGRVLIVAHVKELLEQSVEKLQLVCPEVPCGIYSAGLKRRDTQAPVIVAGIQSIYKRACELGAFDLILVDECFVEGTLVSTPSGDIPIEQIQPGMYVFHARGIGRVAATSARSVGDLITLEYSDGTAITCTRNHPIFTESGWKQAGALELGSLAISVQGMRMLWKTLQTVDQAAGKREAASAERKALEASEILLDLLLENPQQLHAIKGGTRESKSNNERDWACTTHSGRKREDHQTAESVAGATGRRMDYGICGSGIRSPEQGSAQEPEDRYGPSDSDDCDRIGWAQSPVSEAEAGRLPEDAIPGAKRLVRISHHQSTSNRVVHNLHVTGHPSYFANGTLAHNCHLIPREGEGMYQQFLAEAKVVNPHVRVIGLTATPYRLKSGMICTPDHFLNEVCYEVGVRELIVQGYLSPLITKAGLARVDTSSLHVRGGEFVASEMEDLMDQDELVEAACRELVECTPDRRSVLIFATGIRHGQHVQEVLRRKHDIECGFVSGETPATERDATLTAFRDGRLRYLCNVNVLTTGFDAPSVDGVVLLRPTLSPGLYYQMVGRGFRLHPDKTNCLVLDFGGNVLRHGPVDAIQVQERTGGTGAAPAKECPECRAVIAAGYATCPHCGYEFPPPERRTHEAQASQAGILSDQIDDTPYEVLDVLYSVHTKRNAPEDAPKTMRVEYRLGLNHWHSEFICFEHTGFARQKAEAWWSARSPDPVPATAEEGVTLAESGALCATNAITIRTCPGERFDRIVHYDLGEKPEPVEWFARLDPDDVPF